MAGINEPGGGVVPSAWAEKVRNVGDAIVGSALYLGVVLTVGAAIVVAMILA